MSDIVVLGAGGHAKVCIELLREMGEQVGYCIGNHRDPEKCLDVKVLYGDETIVRLKREGYTRAFVAIGSNVLRGRLAQILIENEYELVNAISSSAKISPSATIGKGVAVMPGAVINAMAEVSDLAIVNTGATIDHDCRIGRAAHVAPQSGLAGNVTVGAYAFLGIGTRVIPGITIGENAVVGAGGVVIRDIAPGQTVVGVPTHYVQEREQ